MPRAKPVMGSDKPAWLQVPCPFCRVPAGGICVTSNDRYRDIPHAKRLGAGMLHTLGIKVKDGRGLL